MKSWAYSALLGCLMMTWSAALPAQVARRVVLFDRTEGDGLGLELSTRLRGELRAAGFDVVVLSLPEHAEAARTIQEAGRGLAPAAILILDQVKENGVPVAELWITDRNGSDSLRQRVALIEATSSVRISEFAVKSAELVKAWLAGLSVTGAAAASRVTPERTLPASPTPASPRSTRAVLGLGLGVLGDLSAADAALLPLARAGVIFSPPRLPLTLELRANGGAFSSHVRLVDAEGQAEIGHALANLEFAAYIPTGLSLQPNVFLGAGVYTMSARGIAPDDYTTHSRRAWSGYANFGLGMAYTPVPWLRWSLEALMMAATPPAVVRIGAHSQPERGGWLALLSTGIACIF